MLATLKRSSDPRAGWRAGLFAVTTLTLTLPLTLTCGAAQAAVVAFERTTGGQPTFNRPLEDLSGLSSIGTATAYDVQSFTVSTSGTYSFAGNSTFDSFFFLYGGAFDASSPLSNGLVGNDDAAGFNISGVSFDLVAGEQYFAVTTSYENADSGAYALSAAGPGNIIGLSSSTASEQVTILSGDTSGSPTFNRPLEDLSGLSAIGTDVSYDLVEFTVGASGAYGLTALADFDSFVFLYSGFDPSAPLTGGLYANDDLVSFVSSGFTADLLAGVMYRAIVTSYENSDFGDYVLTFAGPSSVTLAGGPGGVPEPSSWALMILGFAGVGAMARAGRTRGRDGGRTAHAVGPA